MADWKIPLFEPDLTEEDAHAAAEPIRDRWLTMGERTQRFEQAFSQRLGGGHSVAVSNGTAALHLALMAYDIGPGDEVIVPSLTFVACANVIIAVGAQPVFADCCGLDDWTVSPDDIQAKITDRTKAVIAVHYAGFPCRMEAIVPIAKKHRLHIIEDCAHALFSSRQETNCGRFGDIGCFSFFSNKNMTTGEGGMAVTGDKAIADRLRLLRSHGMTSPTLDRYEGRAFSYDVAAFGLNYRPSEIVSALGLSQIQRLDSNLQKRQDVYSIYTEALGDVKGISIPFLERTGDDVGFHIFPILLDSPDAREPFMQSLKAEGIQTSIHYPPIHSFSAYRRLLNETDPGCPVTEEVAAREVTLPFYPSMTHENIESVCDAVKRHAIKSPK